MIFHFSFSCECMCVCGECAFKTNTNLLKIPALELQDLQKLENREDKSFNSFKIEFLCENHTFFFKITFSQIFFFYFEV